MKKLIKIILLLAAVNIAGRISNGERITAPPLSETAECMQDIAADFADLAALLFNYST
ncbi:MAG: hypothetical protein IJ779_00215 [Ruminococcus sp.]|nr:hypothetical protein [Ruminococcus sp.]